MDKVLAAALKARPITTWGFDVNPTTEVLGINVTAVLDHLFPDYRDMKKWHLRSYEADRVAIEAFCTQHGALYYARGREDFSLTEARELALEAGLSAVVYEDLS
jgi:hypothetical protein